MPTSVVHKPNASHPIMTTGQRADVSCSRSKSQDEIKRLLEGASLNFNVCPPKRVELDLMDAVFVHLIGLDKAREYTEKLSAGGYVSVKQPKLFKNLAGAHTVTSSTSNTAEDSQLVQSQIWCWTGICTDGGLATIKLLNDIIWDCLPDTNIKNLFIVPLDTTHTFPVAYGQMEGARPDFVLLPKNEITNPSYPNFSAVLSPGELRTSHPSSPLLQVTSYNRVTNFAQPGRRFTVSLALTGRQSTLVRTDRSGMEDCTLDITSSGGAINYIRVLVGFAIASEQDLGLHPSFIFKNKRCCTTTVPYPRKDLGLFEKGMLSESEKTANTLLESRKRVKLVARTVSHIVCRQSAFESAPLCSDILGFIHSMPSVCGRCVQTFVARKKGNDASRLLVLKRSWQEDRHQVDERRFHEVARDGGMTNVLLAKDVYKSYVDGREDTTLHNVRRFAGSAVQPLGIENRTLSNLIYDLKRPLQYFWSLQDFVLGVTDAMEGHKFLVEKAKILHHDISNNNIVLALHPNESSRGYLIDLDMATDYIPEERPVVRDRETAVDADFLFEDADNTSTTLRDVKGDRTGTTPYMAIGVLIGEYHGVSEDLESFYYVLFLFFFSYSGPLPGDVLKKAHENNYVKSLGDEGAEYRTHMLTWPEPMRDWAQDCLPAIADSKANLFRNRYRLRTALQSTIKKWVGEGVHGHNPAVWPYPQYDL
ncbi:hypothetical protein DFH11DRAFT_1808591 [Phellopilus nigrolimitatus]|nr:hypothetical protein DFH11DRAFT_1808591 [Phellopilus nigrolimitatus]